jgi:outer membrane immunogenic protein
MLLIGMARMQGPAWVSVLWAGTSTILIRIIDTNYFPTPKNSATRGNGGYFGAQVGYNVQNANLVYGIEGNLMANVASVAHSGNPSCENYSFDADLKGRGSIVGRLGMVTASNDLLYMTGGLALAKIDQKHYDCEFRGWHNAVYTGWTIGAGWEHSLATSVSFRLDANYSRYNKKTWTDQTDENFGLQPTTFQVGGGLNYRF